MAFGKHQKKGKTIPPPIGPNGQPKKRGRGRPRKSSPPPEKQRPIEFTGDSESSESESENEADHYDPKKRPVQKKRRGGGQAQQDPKRRGRPRKPAPVQPESNEEMEQEQQDQQDPQEEPDVAPEVPRPKRTYLPREHEAAVQRAINEIFNTVKFWNESRNRDFKLVYGIGGRSLRDRLGKRRQKERAAMREANQIATLEDYENLFREDTYISFQEYQGLPWQFYIKDTMERGETDWSDDQIREIEEDYGLKTLQVQAFIAKLKEGGLAHVPAPDPVPVQPPRVVNVPGGLSQEDRDKVKEIFANRPVWTDEQIRAFCDENGVQEVRLKCYLHHLRNSNNVHPGGQQPMGDEEEEPEEAEMEVDHEQDYVENEPEDDGDFGYENEDEMNALEDEEEHEEHHAENALEHHVKEEQQEDIQALFADFPQENQQGGDVKPEIVPAEVLHMENNAEHRHAGQNTPEQDYVPLRVEVKPEVQGDALNMENNVEQNGPEDDGGFGYVNEEEMNELMRDDLEEEVPEEDDIGDDIEMEQEVQEEEDPGMENDAERPENREGHGYVQGVQLDVLDQQDQQENGDEEEEEGEGHDEYEDEFDLNPAHPPNQNHRQIIHEEQDVLDDQQQYNVPEDEEEPQAPPFWTLAPCCHPIPRELEPWHEEKFVSQTNQFQFDWKDVYNVQRTLPRHLRTGDETYDNYLQSAYGFWKVASEEVIEELEGLISLTEVEIKDWFKKRRDYDGLQYTPQTRLSLGEWKLEQAYLELNKFLKEREVFNIVCHWTRLEPKYMAWRLRELEADIPLIVTKGVAIPLIDALENAEMFRSTLPEYLMRDDESEENALEQLAILIVFRNSQAYCLESMVTPRLSEDEIVDWLKKRFLLTRENARPLRIKEKTWKLHKCSWWYNEETINARVHVMARYAGVTIWKVHDFIRRNGNAQVLRVGDEETEPVEELERALERYFVDNGRNADGSRIEDQE